MRGSDPTKYYVEKCIKRGDNNISKDDVYSSYSWFCRAKKLPVESEQSFSRKLHELGFPYKLFRGKGKDTREYCWENVEVTDWKILEDKEQEILDRIGELTDEEREEMK